MTAKITLQTRVTRHDSILFTELEDAVMMMSIDNGEYYNLSAVSADIWKTLETPQLVQAICEHLMQVYEVDQGICQNETIAFIQDLHKLGMVTLT